MKMSDKIEINNAKEEVIEIAETCIRCGLCKELCPVFRALRQEDQGPRGKMILFGNKVFEKEVFDCSLCGACEKKCPLNIPICKAIKKARQVLNLRGKEQKPNKDMLEKINQNKNPFED